VFSRVPDAAGCNFHGDVVHYPGQVGSAGKRQEAGFPDWIERFFKPPKILNALKMIAMPEN
jgi:hypothetical protein